MSLCLKFGSDTFSSTSNNSTSSSDSSNGMIYINAVTRYEVDYRAQLSQHPLDAGVSIADHVVSSNPIYRISGVISAADISLTPYFLQIASQKPINGDRPPNKLDIKTTTSGLTKFLPDVVGQWLSSTEPEIIADENERTDYAPRFLDMIERVMTYITYNPSTKKFRNSIVPITLYEMNNSKVLGNPITDLVITSFTRSEDPDTGDALFFDMELEKARFVEIQTAQLPTNVSNKMKKAATPNSKKTNVDSTEKPVSSTDSSSPDIDKLREASLVKGG
jgi:hypothetical protein